MVGSKKIKIRKITNPDLRQNASARHAYQELQKPYSPLRICNIYLPYPDF